MAQTHYFYYIRYAISNSVILLYLLINKTNGWQTGGFFECFICHYCFFFRINFRFQPKGCDSFHDMVRKSMSFEHVAIVNVEKSYMIYFWGIT